MPLTAKGGIKRMSWNAAGQLAVYTDCSGRNTRFGYDVLGTQVSTQDAAGHLTQAEADALGRVTRLLEPALPSQAPAEHRFVYNGEGKLLAYVDPLSPQSRSVELSMLSVGSHCSIAIRHRVGDAGPLEVVAQPRDVYFANRICGYETCSA